MTDPAHDNALPLDELIVRYAEARLDAAGVAALDAALQRDPAARDRFVALLTHARCLAELLTTEASFAHSLSPRERAEHQPRTTSPAPSSPFRLRRPFLLAAALLLAACGFAIVAIALNNRQSTIDQPQSPPAPLASVTDVLDGTLMIDDQLATAGGDYRGHTVSLDAGEAEFMLPKRVTVKLRGSTKLTIHDPMNVAMAHGKAEFDCPPGAKGYTVYLPGGAKVIDRGTRFTVSADYTGRSRVAVLEGAVEASCAGSGLVLTAFDAAEVRDGRFVRIPAVLPGDLADVVALSDKATLDTGTRDFAAFGRWRGEAVELVGRQRGIAPFDGPTMLQFLHTGPNGPNRTGGSELYQAIDLRPFRDLIDTGRLTLRVTARFNRVRGDAQTDTQFGITVFVGVGPVDQFLSEQSAKLAGEMILTDADPATWQPLIAAGRVSSGAEYAVVELVALENVYNDIAGIEFDGHYADGVEIELIVAPPAEPPPPSEATLESDHNPAGRNHESTVPASR